MVRNKQLQMKYMHMHNQFTASMQDLHTHTPIGPREAPIKKKNLLWHLL